MSDPYPSITALVSDRSRTAGPLWGVSGSLYLIQEGEVGPIKIGIARDIKRRLQSLQCGNPRPLRLVARYSGRMLDCLAAEQAALRNFAELRSGEWLHTTLSAITAFVDGQERSLSRSE